MKQRRGSIVREMQALKVAILARKGTEFDREVYPTSTRPYLHHDVSVREPDVGEIGSVLAHRSCIRWSGFFVGCGTRVHYTAMSKDPEEPSSVAYLHKGRLMVIVCQSTQAGIAQMNDNSPERVSIYEEAPEIDFVSTSAPLDRTCLNSQGAYEAMTRNYYFSFAANERLF